MVPMLVMIVNTWTDSWYLACLLTPRLLGTTGAWRPHFPRPLTHPGGLLCDSGRPALTQSTSQFTIASNMVKTGDILGHQHHHCKHCTVGRGLKGNVILPWRESGYLHTSHHQHHYQYNFRVFCSS